MFTPTPDNSTCDGSEWGITMDWVDLEWSGKEWRGQSTLMVALVGPEEAPADPHWRVPSKHWGTFHRVRQKQPSD